MNPQAAESEPSIKLAPPERELAYYTVANAPYFVGAVALLNSLRRVGEEAPLFVVDCGLTADQRERLSSRATVIPRDGNLHPVVQKATGQLTRPAETMVFIDADILVTRPLDPIVQEAKTGRFVAFEDFYNHDRFFDEWSSPELGQAQRRPYVNSGLFAFSWDTAREFLPTFAAMQQRLDLAPTFINRPDMQAHPYFYADQDLLNALLCTRYDGRTTRFDRKLFPFQPFDGIELTSDGPPFCRDADGAAPFALHHIHRKPWLAPVPANAYSRLFTMLVSEPDACLRLNPSELPLRLRDHPLAPIDRLRVSSQQIVSQRLRGKLKIRPRIAGLRAHFNAS
jgi:hypothetical protein